MGNSMRKQHYYNPNVRTNTGPSYNMQPDPPATPRTRQQWMEANAAARLAAQPRAGPYSQLSAPIVSSIDPHALTQNPLDPFQDNIYYLLTTYKGRNNNFDLRGDPPLQPGWLSGSTQDQLVQIDSLERLTTYGSTTQITGCGPPPPIRY